MRRVLDEECIRLTMDFKKPRTELSVTFGWLDLDASGGFGLWSSLITNGRRFGMVKEKW
jgi:hypothetical protein